MTSLQRFFYTAVSNNYFKEKQSNKRLVINPLWLTGSLNLVFKRSFSKLSSEGQFYKSNVTIECKDLVIWGTNIFSTVGVKYTRTQLSMVRLAPYQYSVIIGLILSDAWLRFASKRSKNALLGFKQSEAKSQYFVFVFTLLSHYCSSYPLVVTGSRLKKNDRVTIRNSINAVFH
jgi:LAGLIDADG DNA endonuclease family